MSKIWEYLKALGNRLFQITIRYPLAAAATVLIVVGAVLITVFGKNIQIGGLLGKIWGKKPNVDPNIRVLPPTERVDGKGDVIPPGQPDDKGYVQTPASIEIKEPGLFSDDSTITIIHPENGEIVLPLPTGVKNKDVESVIEIQPSVFQIKNNDKGVDANEVLDILGKS